MSRQIESQEPRQHASQDVRPHKQARLDQAPSLGSPEREKQSFPLHNLVKSTSPRFLYEYSAMAFPNALGSDLGAAEPPRVHSFAYNTGTRKEPRCRISFSLREYTSRATLWSCLAAYAVDVLPIVKIVDMNRFKSRCEEFWNNTFHDLIFEAIVAGVMVIGALFQKGLMTEEEEMRIAQHAKDILEDSAIAYTPSVQHIVAWILRTFYLRATTRPHLAWVASCTTMHLVEGCGLHMRSDMEQTVDDSTVATGSMLSHVYEAAITFNRLTSFEYGRSRVTIPNAYQIKFAQVPTDPSRQLFFIADIIPTDDTARDANQMELELLQALQVISTIRAGHDVVDLSKADMGFAIFRRLRVLHRRIETKYVDIICEMGMASLPAARRIAEHEKPWWVVISTPFHFLCCLLAIDTTQSLEQAWQTMDTIEFVGQHFKSHLVTEGVYTARMLVRAALHRAQKKKQLLDNIVLRSQEGPAVAVPTPGYATNEIHFDDDEWHRIIETLCSLEPLETFQNSDFNFADPLPDSRTGFITPGL